MRVTEIVQQLPASTEWMVLFNLAPLRLLNNDTTIKRMFFLPDETDLDLYSHTILSNTGRLLAGKEKAEIVRADGTSPSFIHENADGEETLYRRFSDQLAEFSIDEADCLGLGEMTPFPPVVLYLRINGELGEAEALFRQIPSEAHFAMLKAVGVEFLGGEQAGGYYRARFRNHLPTHIQMAQLARFSRTDHCNLFFLQHGTIDTVLLDGLSRAAHDRVGQARDKALAAIVRLGDEACQRQVSLVCQPPPPAKQFEYGDIVPLGFVLKALYPDNSSGGLFKNYGIRKQIRHLLQSKRQGKLWSYHTGGLVTSTDSALILQGNYDPQAVEALELFADGYGGYYPQLWSETAEQGKMAAGFRNRHWCQADFATTCLIRTLRKEADHKPKTSIGFITSHFESRSGLFFANPYMVDWLLAAALTGDDAANELRQQLAAEVMASINPDYSFGRYDVPLSTSLAILCLAELGTNNRVLRLAQLRLLDFMESDGTWPAGIPFYSSEAIQADQIPAPIMVRVMFGDQHWQTIRVKHGFYRISFYKDEPKMVTTSLAILALSQAGRADIGDDDAGISHGQCYTRIHPRYLCHDHLEYITRFALPPYISEQS